jgi:hypothetical protein
LNSMLILVTSFGKIRAPGPTRIHSSYRNASVFGSINGTSNGSEDSFVGEAAKAAEEALGGVAEGNSVPSTESVSIRWTSIEADWYLNHTSRNLRMRFIMCTMMAVWCWRSLSRSSMLSRDFDILGRRSADAFDWSVADL